MNGNGVLSGGAVLALIVSGFTAFGGEYAALRRELRAFYPDECHGVCKDPRQTNSVAAIGRELDAWAAAPSSPAVRGRARCWGFGRRVIDRSGSTMLTESCVNSM